MSGNQTAVPMTQVAVPVVLCNLVIRDRNNFSGASFIVWVPALNCRILLHGSWKERLVLVPYIAVVVGLTIGSCLHLD